MSNSDIEFMCGLVGHLDDTYNSKIRQATDLQCNIINTLTTCESTGLNVNVPQLKSELMQVIRLLNN